MKKRSLLKLGLTTACLAAFAGGFVACDKDDSSSDYAGLRLDRTSYIFNVGETMELNVLDVNEEVSGVVWNSKNPNFVTVDANGKITAVAKGNATITATVDGKEFTCSVTVRNRSVDFLSAYDNVVLDIDDNSDAFVRSVDLDVIVDVNRVNTEADVTWTSADPTIVTVEDGIVSALKKGETIVTASTVVAGETYSRDFSVFVYPEYVKVNKATSFLNLENVSDGIAFAYDGVAENIESVEFDGVKLTKKEYTISEGEIILNKNCYAKSGVYGTGTGRHELIVIEADTDYTSNKYAYPLVLADYVVDSKETLAALPDYLTASFMACYGTANYENKYIVLADDIDFENGVYQYSGLTTANYGKNVGAYFRYSTFDGYGHSITNIQFKGNGLLGALTESFVKDVALVDVTVLGTTALCGAMAKSAVVENVFIIGEGNKASANQFFVSSRITNKDYVGSVVNCVVIDKSNLGNGTTGKKAALGGIQAKTVIDGNVVVTEGYSVVNFATGENYTDNELVEGSNTQLSHSDTAGLIAALTALAAKDNSWTFDTATNTLYLMGNAVYTIVTE